MIRRSPLDGVTLIDGLRELPFLAQFDVRVDEQHPDALATVHGIALSLEPNSVAGDERLAALWLGPDEWLVVGSADETALTDALTPVGGSVVDVSANRTTLELRGRTRPRAARVRLPDRPAPARLRSGPLRADAPCPRERAHLARRRRTGGHVAALRPALVCGLCRRLARRRSERSHRLSVDSSNSRRVANCS